MNALRLFIVILCGLAPVLVVAHGDEKTFELEVGNYFIDVGYDQEFAVGRDTLLDFQLFDTSSNTAASYSSITITLESGSTVQWERVITKPELGKAVTSLVPSEPGYWDLRVIFSAESLVLADTSFPVYIAERERDPYFIPIAFIALTVLGGYAFYRKRTA